MHLLYLLLHLQCLMLNLISRKNNTHQDLNRKKKLNGSKFYNLGKLAEPCQLSAMVKSGNEFSHYILPHCDIDKHASKVNKLTVKTVDGDPQTVKRRANG